MKPGSKPPTTGSPPDTGRWLVSNFPAAFLLKSHLQSKLNDPQLIKSKKPGPAPTGMYQPTNL